MMASTEQKKYELIKFVLAIPREVFALAEEIQMLQTKAMVNMVGQIGADIPGHSTEQ